MREKRLRLKMACDMCAFVAVTTGMVAGLSVMAWLQGNISTVSLITMLAISLPWAVCGHLSVVWLAHQQEVMKRKAPASKRGHRCK